MSKNNNNINSYKKKGLLVTINHTDVNEDTFSCGIAVDSVLDGVVQNKPFVHHTTTNIRDKSSNVIHHLPVLSTSCITESTNKDSTSTSGESDTKKSFYVYSDIFEADSWKKILDEAKNMMKKNFEERNISFEDINAVETYTDTEFEDDLLKAIGNSKDEKGKSVFHYLRDIKKIYCESLDSHPDIKKKIYNTVRINPKELSKSCLDKVDNPWTWCRYPKDHSTFPDKIDYNKSPTIKMKIWEWVPTETKASDIVISSVRQVLCTSIYDYTIDPMNTREPISSVNDFMKFVYRSGDMKKGIQKLFNLRARISLLAPSIWWTDKECWIIFKISIMKVYGKFFIDSSFKRISDEEHERDMSDVREAIDYMNNHSSVNNDGGNGNNYNVNNNLDDNSQQFNVGVGGGNDDYIDTQQQQQQQQQQNYHINNINNDGDVDPLYDGIEDEPVLKSLLHSGVESNNNNNNNFITRKRKTGNGITDDIITPDSSNNSKKQKRTHGK